ncbi:hypothetical protein WI79_01170 [Burkholderia ubonensis]|nr:hypothetical protein WI79_01170 [Burkholderia ubonensis]
MLEHRVRGAYVRLLRRLVSAAKQDLSSRSPLHVVDAIPRAVVDARLDTAFRDAILQRVEPGVEELGGSDGEYRGM